jgi:hypothetical protein
MMAKKYDDVFSASVLLKAKVFVNLGSGHAERLTNKDLYAKKNMFFEIKVRILTPKRAV